MRQVALLFVLMFGSALAVQGARIDTVWVNSLSMGKNVEVLYVLPDAMLGSTPQRCPVIYLLHGYGGDAKVWLQMKPGLREIADEKKIILACPDGENSWYWDSPRNPTYRYETFLTEELIAYTDSCYLTVPSRQGRAITGFSMGGHGALWNAIRHADVFGAAGSMSGGVDIRPFPKNWEISKQLGPLVGNEEVWNAHSVVNQVKCLKEGDLAIIVDCGVDDFFLEVNKDLHHLLLARKIGHDFIVRPGAHTASYWNNAIDYQILFFEKFFKK